MVKQMAIAIAVVAAAGVVRAAVPPVRAMYVDTMAKEQAVRKALDDPRSTELVLKAVHEVVAGYEALVRHYPASGYSDNALWQAGRLSLDAFARFGQAQDRDTGVRLLRKLAAAYPTSKLARRAPEEIARADKNPVAAPVAAERDVPIVESTPDPPPAVSKAPARPSPVSAAATARPTPSRGVVSIKEIRRTVLPDAVRVTIELDSEVPFHEERIADPDRVFVDLPSTRPASPLGEQTLRFEGDADIVRQIRIGRHPNSTTRIVLDAAGVSSYSVYPLYEPYRLVIDCVRSDSGRRNAAVAERQPSAERRGAVTEREASAERRAPVSDREASAERKPPLSARPSAPAALVARTFAPTWQRSAPNVTSQHGITLAEAHTPAAPPIVVAEPAARAVDPAAIAATTGSTMPAPPPQPMLSAPPARNSNGGFSIARQLGLNVSRIVIDPGHGGHDPGAQARGVTEAELVLDVALRLEKLLQKQAGVEVILTRRTDDFIPLQERTAIANREGADLFLSIHANASSSAVAHGVETYFLNFASNLGAAAVAARENAASGQAMGALPDIVKSIALNNKLDESRDFAADVQQAMLEHLRPANKLVKDLGVKQAPFVVLIGAAMPSVLAEISFVTNPQEARLLKGGAYRQRIAEGLFAAIRKYQSSLKNAVTTAQEQ